MDERYTRLVFTTLQANINTVFTSTFVVIVVEDDRTNDYRTGTFGIATNSYL